MATSERSKLIKSSLIVVTLIIIIGVAQFFLVKPYPIFSKAIVKDPLVVDIVAPGADRDNIFVQDNKLPPDFFQREGVIGLFEKYRELDPENGITSIRSDIGIWSFYLVLTNFCFIFPAIVSAMLFSYTGVIITSIFISLTIVASFIYYYLPLLIIQFNTFLLFIHSRLSFDEVELVKNHIIYYMDSQIAFLKSLIISEAVIITLAGIVTLLVYDAVTSKLSKSLEDRNNDYSSLKVKMARLEESDNELQKLSKKFVRITSRLTILQGYTQEVGKTLNVTDVCKKTLKVIVSVMGAEKCCIYLYDDETGELSARESFGWSEDEKKEKSIVDKEDPGLIMRAIKTEKVQSVDPERENVAKAAFEMNKTKKIPSVMCAPLVLGEKKIGALNIEKMEEAPTQEEIKLLYYVAILTSMSIENSKLFMKTEQLANFDGLTKMYTHRYMQDFIDRELEKSERYNHPLSLVLTDIDHFKNFNDKYGHQVGDMVLAETAKVLREAVRNIDVAARYGGEEFMAVLPETDYKGAYAFAERLRRMVEAKSYYNEKTNENLRVTISIGVSQYPLHHTDKAKLIEKADQALYEAKESGRNRVKIAKISREVLKKLQEKKNGK